MRYELQRSERTAQSVGTAGVGGKRAILEHPEVSILESAIKRNCVRKRENLRISMRIDLEVLSSFDLIITTSTSDSECVR